MSTIAAIPTRYAGCHFRSRLEARWAVFFDTLGIRWEYEPQGFTGYYGKPYLPDFHLPDVDVRTAGRGPYVEVKPTYDALHADGCRIGACVDWGQTPMSQTGLLILGPIPDPRFGVPAHSIVWWDQEQKGLCHHQLAFHNTYDDNWMLMSYSPEPYGGWDSASGLPPHATPVATSLDAMGVGALPWKGGYIVARALTAARSARFEHGQSGAT